MNKIFKLIWSNALNGWVVCSELGKKSKSSSKSTMLVSMLLFPSMAFALDCTVSANGSYLVGNVSPSCNNIQANNNVNQSGTAVFYILTQSKLYESLKVGDTKLVAKVNGGYGGIGNQYASGPNAAIDAGYLDFTIEGNGNITGIGTHSNVGVTAKDVSLNITNTYSATNGSGGVASYGVLVGSTIDSGEGVTHNGKYSTVTVNDLKISQKATGGLFNPILNNGIRAIQGANQNSGNGSAGKVIVNGNLDMTLAGNRSIGIYVSGNSTNHGSAESIGQNGQLTPEVILNGLNNKIVVSKGTGSSWTKWDSHAVKLGKVRYAGEGAGILRVNGALDIDTTAALAGGGIKMMRNSLLVADSANSSTSIKTNGYALEIGGHDDMNSNGEYEQAASHGLKASFKDAIFTTTGTSVDPLITGATARKDLIFVDQGQSGVGINFSGNKTNLTAHNDGYIINVSSNYTAPNYKYYSNTYDSVTGEEQGHEKFESSSVTLTATDAGSMTGLVWKGGVKVNEKQVLDPNDKKFPTLDLNLSNNFVWNLNKKSSETTSLFDTAEISSGAVINGAYDVAGGNNYTLKAEVKRIDNNGVVHTEKGKVNSSGGILSLDNIYHNQYNDLLTIDGNYSGSNNAIVKMNTLWNAPGTDDGTNSVSDVLRIKGTATGTTRVVPVNVNGVLNTIDGDVIQIDKIINTVPVIYVETSGTDAFTGSARTTGIQQVQLLKRTNGTSDEYYWSAKALENGIDIYNPETPNYTQMPIANMELGYTTLATLHERRGENQTLAWDDCGTCVKDNKGQSWGRIVGSHLDLEGKNRFNLNGEQYVLQLGHDFIIHENVEKQTRNHTGGYISYGRSDIDFEDHYRTVDGKLSDTKHTGSGKTDAFSLGLYNTYYDKNGSYLDLIGQVSHLRNTYNSEGLKQVKQNGFGALISAEVGRPYALTKHEASESGWLLEPQAQLTYQYLDLKSFNDDVRTVDQNDQHGLRGRVGVRVAHNREAKGLKTDTVYFTANVLHDFLNQSDIDIGPDRIKEKYSNTWGSLGVGMQLPISQHGYFYADGRYEHSFSSEKRETYKGTLGLKFTWK